MFTNVGLSEAAIFSIAVDIIQAPSWFLSFKRSSHNALLLTFKELLQIRMPKTSTKLQSLGALSDEVLSEIFVFFFLNIFPVEFVYRIVELFLLEGRKVLYRFGLAFFSIFKRDIKSWSVNSSSQMWNAIRLKCHSGEVSYSLLRNKAYDYDKLSSRIFPISRSSIGASEKMNLVVRNDSDKFKVLSFFDAKSQNPSIFNVHGKSLEFSHSTRNCLYIVYKNSMILSEAMACTLHGFLPESFLQLGNLSIVYSTTKHGWGLRNLHSYASGYSPAIVLIKALGGPAVIGALICGDSLSPPSKKFRGDNRTQVFRLDPGFEVCLSAMSIPNKLSSTIFEHEMPSNTMSVCLLQYAVSCREYLSFGGSEQFNTNAIRLDESLHTCKVKTNTAFKV